MPSITFDQPLWLKAEISIEKSLNVIVHLGGFHTLMSFVGSIRLLQKSKRAQYLTKVFLGLSSSQEQIGKAGITLFVLLYGGKFEDTLEQLRYTNYMKMAASSSKMAPSKLPPTERSAWFHSLRVYLQVFTSYYFFFTCFNNYILIDK